MKNSKLLFRNIVLLLALTLILNPLMSLSFGDPAFSAHPMRFAISAVVLSVIGGLLMTWFQQRANKQQAG